MPDGGQEMLCFRNPRNGQILGVFSSFNARSEVAQIAGDETSIGFADFGPGDSFFWSFPR